MGTNVGAVYLLHPPPHDFLSSPAGREIADSRHVFQNSVKSFMRVLSCNIVIMMGNYHF